jgi:hypothetical protein
MNRPIKPPKPLPSAPVKEEANEEDFPPPVEPLPMPEDNLPIPDTVGQERPPLPTPAPPSDLRPTSSSTSSTRKSSFLTPEHWATAAIGHRPFQKNRYQLSPTTELDTSQSSLPPQRQSQPPLAFAPAPPSSLLTKITTTKPPAPLPSSLSPVSDPSPVITSPDNEIVSERLRMYHKVHFSDEWLVLTIVMHIILFAFLLSIGYAGLTPLSLAILLTAATLVVLLLIISRSYVGKLPKSLDWSQNVIRTPDQETDLITDDTIYLLGAAAIIEGFALALYPVVTARYSRQNDVIDQRGFRSYTTLVQILAFGSMIVFGFHKILRPSNRLDPLRTIFEVSSSLPHSDSLPVALTHSLYLSSCLFLAPLSTLSTLSSLSWSSYLCVGTLSTAQHYSN